ncbi:MAG: MerR family transcriptional regulator [Flammeovirgaceae bacterium]|nr:MerR family transcriptional regulator [Flammeovirgaceae bacterium]
MDIEKRYYSIGEVAEKFGVSTSLIRFWEGQFDTIKPKKNKNGARQYTTNDITAIQTIYHLVKEKGYTLNGAKELIKKNNNVKENIDVIDSLKRIKGFLIDVKSNLP